MTVKIMNADCRDALRDMPDQSVHCCVTSPPYFGLRDYGHAGQIGLEPTPDEFVAAMVEVFREVKRVLRDDGTLWLNLGDSYFQGHGGSSTMGNGATMRKRVSKQNNARSRDDVDVSSWSNRDASRKEVIPGCKPKDLMGIPWRVAFALQADGWWLRQDIVWHKPNPMPESVTDRCTKAHEYVFLMSKNPRYYFDAEAIAEEQTKGSAGSHFDTGKTADHQQGRSQSGERKQAVRAAELAKAHGLTTEHIAAIRAVGITDAGKAQKTQDGYGKNDPAIQALADEAKRALGGYYREFLIAETRNKRSVWTVPTMPFKEAHFATFPTALIEPCVLAGCPTGGTVLDPFGGAGTTGLVADRLQRNAILIELNPEYAAMAKRRVVNDAPLFVDAAE